MVKRIIDLNGSARVNDKVNGITPLHSAVAKGSLKLVKLWIENGASPDINIGTYSYGHSKQLLTT